MVRRKVTVHNLSGLHLRPAQVLSNEAIKYRSLVSFIFKGATANAKSILSVLGACVKADDEIELICEGEDEEEAIDALVRIIESGLGE